MPGHPGRERSTRKERSRLQRRTGRKLTRLLARVAGRHAADSRPVKPGRTLPAGTADHGDLARAGEATAVLAAVERPWSLRPWSLGARALRPWKLSGKLLS